MFSVSTLSELLSVFSERNPDSVCFRFLVHGGTPLEVRSDELYERSIACARWLHENSEPNERVLVVTHHGIDYIVGLFGCFYAGRVAIPVPSPRQGRALLRLSALVQHSRVRLALTGSVPSMKVRDELSKNLNGKDINWQLIQTIEKETSTDFRLPPVPPESLAIIQYTSGSTSQPKGVMLSHAAILKNIEMLIDRSQCTSDDHIVSWLPTYHDMGLISGVLCPLMAGISATLLAPDEFTQRPARWLEAITTYNGTISGAPNFGYDLCARRIHDEQMRLFDLTRWRVAFCGAERVQAETLQRFSDAFLKVGFSSKSFCPCYGLAEGTVGVAFKKPGDNLVALAFEPEALLSGHATSTAGKGVKLVASGRPLAGLEVKIRDQAKGGVISDCQVGEICVQGASLGLGYFDDPSATNHAFVDNESEEWQGRWLRTGDLGFLLGGELFITGRIKDLIICRGVNHYPEDIEYTVVTSHPTLKFGTTVAFGVEIDGEERTVVAQEIDASATNLTELSSLIREQVAAIHGLQLHDLVYVRTGTLLRTSSGKIQRNRCRDAYVEDTLIRAIRHDAPQFIQRTRKTKGETIEIVAQTMAELLNAKSVGATDDFFALGGHSLLATQLVSRLRERLGVEIPIRAIFESPTPNAITAYVESLGVRSLDSHVLHIDGTESLQLSFSQERMWFLYQLDPNSTAYNVAGAGLLEGPLDASVLERAINHVVSCHDTLRSNYPNVDGTPRVLIHHELRIHLPIVSLNNEVRPLERATELASRLAQLPFNISDEPLLRVALYELDSMHHVFAVCMHHLVSDAWTMGVFAEQIAECYAAFRDGKTPSRLLKTTYFDFASYQRHRFIADHVSKGLAYFRNVLKGARVLEFPTDHPRKPGQSSEGALETFEIALEAWNELREFSLAHAVTPFMVLLSVFAVVIHRFTGEDDFVIGVPIANRNHIDAEHLIGTLVNTLPIRIRFETGISGEELLRQVSTMCLDAYAYQDVPFEYLVRELDIERVPGRSPLVQVMFDFQNTHWDLHAFEGVLVRPVILERRATQFDMSLVISDNAFSHNCGIEYASNWFDRGTVEGLCRQFLQVFKELQINPATPIDRLPLIDNEGIRMLLADCRANCTYEKSSLRIPERLEHWAQVTPEALAVVDESGALSYSELGCRVDSMVLALQAVDVKPGDRVIVCLERSKEILVSLLAVLKIGATYVPLDPRYPADRVAYIAQDSRPKVAITTREIARVILHLADVRLLSLEEIHWDGHSQANTQVQPSSAGAYIIYTSGSTGRPKGVEIPISALGNFLESMLVEPGLSAADRWLSVTTISFDIAALELFLPIVAGACVYIASASMVMDGSLLTKAIDDFDTTIMQATPATWRMLIDSGFRGGPRLTMLCGGEALVPELANALLERGRALWNMYGPTETTIWSTLHRVTSGDERIAIGHAIRNTLVYVLDDYLNLLPNGFAGEIWIGGDGLATGYVDRPELTRERFIRDPYGSEPNDRIYRTGDRGRRRYDGLLECQGRVDHQVKVRGYRIELGEIESVLKEQNQLREVVVIAREMAKHDVRLVAYVVLGQVDGFDAIGALNQLRGVLPEYMIPQACVVLDALPRTPNGKLDRSALPVPTFNEARFDMGKLAPRDVIERRLAVLWTELLGCRQVFVEDSFFQLGGHSLLSVRLIALIRAEWDIELQVLDLLQNPTLERFAALIRERLEGSRQGASSSNYQYLVPLTKHGKKPTLFCIHGAGGGISQFFGMSRYMDEDRPIAAFQAAGVDGKATPHDSIDLMAEEYLRELKAYAPQGPYFLVGFCGGGIIAYEIAQRLVATGDEVRFLALIDAYRPGIHVNYERFKSWSETFRNGGFSALSRRFIQSVKERAHLLYRVIEIAYSRWRGAVIPIDLREFYLIRTYLNATRRHQMKPYPGKLHVFRATETRAELARAAPDLGWTGYAEGGVEMINTPGSHETIVSDSNLEKLALNIRRYLESV